MTLSYRHLLGAVALSAACAAPVWAQTTPAETLAETTAPATKAEILPDIVMGEESAPVTVVEYASFTCSHCAAFHETNFPKLKTEYIDTGKVKFIQRDVYFDAVGLWAGILARCGGDEKYYPVAGMLLDEQSKWIDGKSGEEVATNLRKIGTRAGMDAAQMDACWADEAKIEQLVATFQHHAAADEVQGTPSFVIAGEKVPNQSWEHLKAKIDEKLADAAK